MNYKKASIIITVDWTEILSINAIERSGQLVTLFNRAETTTPLMRKESVQKELDFLLRYLSGSGYHPNKTFEDETAVIYDINFVNIKNGTVYRQPYCKGR